MRIHNQLIILIRPNWILNWGCVSLVCVVGTYLPSVRTAIKEAKEKAEGWLINHDECVGRKMSENGECVCIIGSHVHTDVYLYVRTSVYLHLSQYHELNKIFLWKFATLTRIKLQIMNSLCKSCQMWWWWIGPTPVIYMLMATIYLHL